METPGVVWMSGSFLLVVVELALFDFLSGWSADMEGLLGSRGQAFTISDKVFRTGKKNHATFTFRECADRADCRIERQRARGAALPTQKAVMSLSSRHVTGSCWQLRANESSTTSSRRWKTLACFCLRKFRILAHTIRARGRDGVEKDKILFLISRRRNHPIGGRKGPVCLSTNWLEDKKYDLLMCTHQGNFRKNQPFFPSGFCSPIVHL